MDTIANVQAKCYVKIEIKTEQPHMTRQYGRKKDNKISIYFVFLMLFIINDGWPVRNHYTILDFDQILMTTTTVIHF